MTALVRRGGSNGCVTGIAAVLSSVTFLEDASPVTRDMQYCLACTSRSDPRNRPHIITQHALTSIPPTTRIPSSIMLFPSPYYSPLLFNHIQSPSLLRCANPCFILSHITFLYLELPFLQHNLPSAPTPKIPPLPYYHLLPVSPPLSASITLPRITNEGP